MEQVKIITGDNRAEVEDQINEFLKGCKRHTVNYINFQVTPSGGRLSKMIYTAMISYEKKDDSEN